MLSDVNPSPKIPHHVFTFKIAGDLSSTIL